MKLFLFLKYLFLGLLLLFLLHFETLTIGPVKISHLWKGVVLFVLLFSIIRKQFNPFIYKSLFVFSIFQLVNMDIFINPFIAFQNFLILLLLPVIGMYLLKFSSRQLYSGLRFFAVFVILSFVPYKLGIIQSITQGYDLSIYGGGSGLIGPYQNGHSAAINLAIASLVMLYFVLISKKNKMLYTFLLVLGLFFLVLTFVRTGLVMFVCGAIPLLYRFTQGSWKNKLYLVFIGFLILLSSANYLYKNEIFINRIKGETNYGQEDSFEKLGSGRGLFILTGAKIFIESNNLEKLIGLGEEQKVNEFEKSLGWRIGAHNAIIDILLSNGIIGLLLYSYFLIKVFKYIRKFKSSNNKSLASALFVAFLLMCFFQGFEWVYSNLILMFSIAILYNQKYEKKYILNRGV